MHKFVFLFALLVSVAPIARATPRQDAQVIVNMTVTEDVMAASFEALNELMVGNFQNEAAKAGQLLSEDAAQVLGEMMFAEMIPLLVEAMREEMADAYVYSMSPEALSDFRAFLETPSGTEWAAAQGQLARETIKVAELIAAPIVAEAIERMNVGIENDAWPPGTLASTQAEIRAFMED